ncbi:hypothetical protein ACLOJK_030903 [Asimina triloba]
MNKHACLQVIELKVRLHCKACEKSQFGSFAGVTCLEIDAKISKITAMGYVDRKAVIKAIRKTGRRAEAWKSSSLDAADFPAVNSKKPSRAKFGKLGSWVRDLKSHGRRTLLQGENPLLLVIPTSAKVGAIDENIIIL